MIDAKAGCFICRFDILRLPFDGPVAWRASSAHRDEDCDMAQLGQSTKNVAGPFLISIPGRLEVVDHDEAGMFQGIEFRNNLLESYLVVSRDLQLVV